MAPIYARKGEHVTCINGHIICEFARDVHVGQAGAPPDFTNWQQPEPHKDESVADLKCNICGGSWINGNKRTGYFFHIGPAWRYPWDVSSSSQSEA